MRKCVVHLRCRVARLDADTGATGCTWRGRALRQLPMPECQMHASTHAHAQMYGCSFHSLRLTWSCTQQANSGQFARVHQVIERGAA